MDIMGVNPEVSVKLWNTYVKPRLIFGLVNYTTKERYGIFKSLS
jgi:hypothetical protein